MHWTKHYKPEKDCKFPFQVYVKEDWVGVHPKTEISIKKGDIIVVYGECDPEGHNAADVPRTSKRVHEILDTNYPVFDKTSKNFWIGEVKNAGGPMDYYAKHKVGHFPISKVVPLDIHLWEVEEARKKRIEDQKKKRAAENGVDNDDDDDGDDDDGDDDDDDEEEDIIAQTYGKHSGFHDHWDPNQIEDYSIKSELPAIQNQYDTVASQDDIKVDNNRVPNRPEHSSTSGGSRKVSPLHKRKKKDFRN